MKNKFRLLLNIATICLCVCAIAIGVYSAQTASLNISGSVGFTAHNCDVYVYGTVSGAVDADGKAKSVTPFGTASSYINVHNNTQAWNISDLYFDDLNDVPTGKIANDIIITLKMYNASKFPVKASYNTNLISNMGLTGKVTANVSPTTKVLQANGTISAAQTMTITLSLATQNDFSKISFNLATLVSFEKDTTQKVNYYIGTGDLAGKLCLNVGYVSANEKPAGATTDTPLVWYAYAYSDDGGDTFQTLANTTYTAVSQVNTSYVYRFILQYVLGGYTLSSGATQDGYYYDNADWLLSSAYKFLSTDIHTEFSISVNMCAQLLDKRTINYDYPGNIQTKRESLWLLDYNDLRLLNGELAVSAGSTGYTAYGLASPNGSPGPMSSVVGAAWLLDYDSPMGGTNPEGTNIYYVSDTGYVCENTRTGGMGFSGPTDVGGIRPAFQTRQITGF